ncbi:MAG: DUF1549 domain-containing protein [Planctomycetaceae bacterium]|nr:DUF1549 domain-containing protein [Planctomycetaceae bacterium]
MSRNLLMLTIFVGLLTGLFSSSISDSAFAQQRKKAAPKKAPQTRLPTQAAKVEVEVAPVVARLQTSAIRSANRIDMLVAADLRKHNLKPNPPSADHEFVRRIYLDTNGTIPTAQKAKLFLRSRSSSKRSILIDRLLGQPGYGSQMYNWLADIMRLVDKVNNNTYLRPYSDWVKQSLRDNTPWDKMVNDMLSSEGKVWENPAAGFVLRDPGMPLDNLNNAVRMFMGTRIGCAQCHDHPFDRWTQKEFYQLAAFTGGTEYRLARNNMSKLNNGTIDKAAPGGDRSIEARLGRSIVRLNRAAIWSNNKKQLKFPQDYQYDDAKPGQLTTPTFLFDTKKASFTLPERRQIFADWVTSETNDRFAITIANRLWKKAMGIGLIEPVDDMMGETEASNPELMKFLASEIKRLNFDLKEFQRIIYYSKTYQRQVAYADLDPDKHYRFPGPILRRMTAEQVWDSLLTLTLENPDAILRPDDSQYTSIIDIDVKTTAQQVIQKAKQLDAYNKAQRTSRNKRLYKGQELVRASELPQPLPEGHFVRQFGQSDRAIISDSHTEGTVPQLLTMFNGPVTHMMLERGSVIYNEVTDQKIINDQLDVIFLSMLSRTPTDREVASAKREMRLAGPAGYGNVIWALLNTREFLFIQ